MNIEINTAQLASAIGLMVTVCGILFAAFKLYARLQKTEEATKKNENDIHMILETQFAILDGLKQLNCNGEVSKAHERLRKHVIEK